MSKAFEKMIKRKVAMPDGRYLIYYSFAPSDRPESSARLDPIPAATAAKLAEEK